MLDQGGIHNSMRMPTHRSEHVGVAKAGRLVGWLAARWRVRRPRSRPTSRRVVRIRRGFAAKRSDARDDRKAPRVATRHTPRGEHHQPNGKTVTYGFHGSHTNANPNAPTRINEPRVTSTSKAVPRRRASTTDPARAPAFMSAAPTSRPLERLPVRRNGSTRR